MFPCTRLTFLFSLNSNVVSIHPKQNIVRRRLFRIGSSDCFVDWPWQGLLMFMFQCSSDICWILANMIIARALDCIHRQYWVSARKYTYCYTATTTTKTTKIITACHTSSLPVQKPTVTSTKYIDALASSPKIIRQRQSRLEGGTILWLLSGKQGFIHLWSIVFILPLSLSSNAWLELVFGGANRYIILHKHNYGQHKF